VFTREQRMHRRRRDLFIGVGRRQKGRQPAETRPTDCVAPEPSAAPSK
jgi:hypothetical protein